jgi:fatty acid desaturase
MNDAEEAPDRRLHPVVYWLIVLAIAVSLGVSAPALFLLGFWEMAPLVLLATWLAPKLTRGHL